MMSVFMRMASIFFNARLTDVIENLHNHKDKEIFLKTYSSDMGMKLIQDFIKYMIRRCGRENEVKTVVVLVDEVCSALYDICLFQYIVVCILIIIIICVYLRLRKPASCLVMIQSLPFFIRHC
jgi:hypothetical protein